MLAKAEVDPEAFWQCRILPRPQDVRYLKNVPHSYWDRLCEDGETPLKVGVIYALHPQRKYRLETIKDEIRLGQTSRFDQLFAISAFETELAA